MNNVISRKIRMIAGRSVAFLASAAVLMGMLHMGQVRADASASLSKSGSAEVGKTIKINVRVGGDGPFGGYDGSVSVDGEYLEVVSIGAGNYGTANFSSSSRKFLDYNCNIPSDSTVVVIECKCLKEGSTTVSVSMEVSDPEGTASYSTGASADISISAPVVLSGNNYLSSLSAKHPPLSEATLSMDLLTSFSALFSPL